jgi:5-methylcytosine-specific restriction endonuclease McrA
MSCLEQHDPSFWSYGELAIEGRNDSLSFKVGHLGANRQNEVFMVSVAAGDDLPVFVKPVFKRFLLRKAHCAKCLSPMSDFGMRTLYEFDESGRCSQDSYLACNCGYPVWGLDGGSTHALRAAMNRAEISWRRRQRIAAAGGTHRPSEILEVLALQKNRCVYCGAKFTDERPPTKDHLLAIADGGTDWALNILMACRRCNSRRGDIPFRTYCKLLSQKRNQRIVELLEKRLLATDFLKLPSEALISFDKGLAHHDPKHWRFLDIQSASAAARQNVTRNQLLPRTRRLILSRHARNVNYATGKRSKLTGVDNSE